jgi:hypothetical protein
MAKNMKHPKGNFYGKIGRLIINLICNWQEWITAIHMWEKIVLSCMQSISDFVSLIFKVNFLKLVHIIHYWHDTTVFIMWGQIKGWIHTMGSIQLSRKLTYNTFLESSHQVDPISQSAAFEMTPFKSYKASKFKNDYLYESLYKRGL